MICILSQKCSTVQTYLDFNGSQLNGCRCIKLRDDFIMKKSIIFDAQRCDNNTHYYNFISKRQIVQINKLCLRFAMFTMREVLSCGIENELLNIKSKLWGQPVSCLNFIYLTVQFKYSLILSNDFKSEHKYSCYKNDKNNRKKNQ